MSLRWFRFILVILIGIALGVLYGWVINPGSQRNVSPSTLRIDYQSDYVLMVAEVYHVNGDLAAARDRLAFLGDSPPQGFVTRAIDFAKDRYDQADLAQMEELLKALQGQGAGPELGAYG